MFKKLNSRGDTLVEVMIAVAILSFILATSYTLTSYAARVGQSAKERTQAVAYAQQQAEIIHAYAARDWDTLIGNLPQKNTPNHFNDDWVLDNSGSRTYSDVAANYEVSTTLVADCPDDGSFCTPSDPIKQLTFRIDVEWKSATAATDSSGNIVPDKTRLIVKVSP